MWMKEVSGMVSGKPSIPVPHDMLSAYEELVLPRLEATVHHPYSFGQIVPI